MFRYASIGIMLLLTISFVSAADIVSYYSPTGNVIFNLTGSVPSLNGNNFCFVDGTGCPPAGAGSQWRFNSSGNPSISIIGNNTLVEFLAGTGMTVTHATNAITFTNTVTDTNASTACSGPEVLFGNGTCGNVTGGSGTPGGSDTQIQFNNAGSFGGNANLTWNSTGNILGVTAVLLDTSGNVDPPNAIGTFYYDTDQNTISTHMVGGEVVLQIGQETLVYVRNEIGVTILNGQAVYITGASGNIPTIGLGDRADPDTFKVIGLATEDIGHNSNGFVTINGLVNDIDTSGTPVNESWADGDKLYLSTEGNLSNTNSGVATDGIIVVGNVVRAHASVGKILLTTPNAFTLGNDFNGTLRSSIINKNEGRSAGVGFTAVNNLGHFTTFGIAGSNNTAFPNEVTTYYAPGYGDHWQAVDGAKDFVWFTDPTDTHNNSALRNEVMRLSYSGNLSVTGNVTSSEDVCIVGGKCLSDPLNDSEILALGYNKTVNLTDFYDGRYLTGQLSLYFYNTSDPFNSTYSIMNVTIPTGAVAQINTFTSLGAGDTELANRILSSLNLTILESGAYNQHTTINYTSGSKNVQLKSTIWKRLANGTEVQIGVSPVSSILSPGAYQTVIWTGTITENTIFATGDKLVMKLVAVVSGGGGAPTIDLVVADETAARLDIGINPSDIIVTVTPGGSNTQVQFNNLGVFGGDAGLTFISGTGTLIATILKSNDWTNVTITESQVTDLQNYALLSVVQSDFFNLSQDETVSGSTTFSGTTIFDGAAIFRGDTNVSNPGIMNVNESINVQDLSGTSRILINGSGNTVFNSSGNVTISNTLFVESLVNVTSGVSDCIMAGPTGCALFQNSTCTWITSPDGTTSKVLACNT